jgi:hypothetical protein
MEGSVTLPVRLVEMIDSEKPVAAGSKAGQATLSEEHLEGLLMDRRAADCSDIGRARGQNRGAHDETYESSIGCCRRFDRRHRRVPPFTSTPKLQTKLGQRFLAPTNLTCNQTGFVSSVRNRTVKSCPPVYKLMMRRYPLQKIREIFSPLRLPLELTVKTKECGLSNTRWCRMRWATRCLICRTCRCLGVRRMTPINSPPI